jgi:hypothetical protein
MKRNDRFFALGRATYAKSGMGLKRAGAEGSRGREDGLMDDGDELMGGVGALCLSKSPTSPTKWGTKFGTK